MPDSSEAAGRTRERLYAVNPFARREDYSRNAINSYKFFTALTWLVVLITSVYYSFEAPHEGKKARRTIWGQNHVHRSPFTLNSVITSIYWIVLYILQVGYCWHLFSGNSAYVNAACNVGSHFIFHNALLMGFIHLWCRSFFWLALLLVVIDFFNLSAAYFRHPATPPVIHVATVSGPLAWNFVALYWVGAVAVDAHNLPARIVANIFIWGILVYGMFFLVIYKDYTMGFELSVLSAAIGVAQFEQKIVALQWIFAFVIMAILFLFSLAFAAPTLLGYDPFRRGGVVGEDRERAPLLQESNE